MRESRSLKRVLALSLVLGGSYAAFALQAAPAAEAVPAAVTAALGNYGRPQLDLYRDDELKPGEVMAFSGIRPGMIVAEILPEAGYWSRILSATVGAPNDVYMIVPMGQGGAGRGGRGGPIVKDVSQNDELNRMELANTIIQQPEFPNLKVYWESVDTQISVPKQLDAVVLANGYHKVRSGDLAKVNPAEFNKGVYRSLKSGGVYLVTGAAANRGTGISAANLGRMDPDMVKAEILAAGFTLEAESNLLARANDPHNAAATDTSDMYLFRFRKPANAPNTDMRHPNLQEAMKGYFDYTRRTNPGLIRKGGTQVTRERRVMFHPDMTYQEWGQKGSGDNPWQSGTYFFNSDNHGCMLHLFPVDQQGFVNCGDYLAPAGKKLGDRWCLGGTVREFIGKGYVQFPDVNATEGGTIGNTPTEKAKNFGDLYGYVEKECNNPSYLKEYLTAYYNFRTESGAPTAQLDAEFRAGYGKPLPPPPAPAPGGAGRQD